MKYASKEGSAAANGIRTNFKVYPVQMVTGVPKLKRENRQPGQQNAQTSRASGFQAALKKAVRENNPEECYTVTYDRQSRLQAYYYQQSREYTY